MRAWTTAVIRLRWLVLLGWVVLTVLGGIASSHLGSLLSNSFEVPGSESQQGLNLIQDRFHQRTDGAFTLVATADPKHSVSLPAVAAAAARGAKVLKNGRPGLVLRAGRDAYYVQIYTSLGNVPSSQRTDAVRKAVGKIPGAHLYITGYPAINHDELPLYSQDLSHGELFAIPISLLVLAYMFATVGGVLIPIAFALISIPTTLGGVWIAAHMMNMATYVTNIVTLLGIAIAIDYSMLVVFRFREELEASRDTTTALQTTMATAGRATLFSGSTVAIGLALLAFMPVPMIASMGVGALLVPLVSIAASATLLPALLAVLGPRINSLRLVPKAVLEGRTVSDRGAWARLARTIMRRPVSVLFICAAVLLVIALPALGLKLTAGDNRSLPGGTEATEGLFVLERTLGPGALIPNQIVIDSGRPGGALSPTLEASELKLVSLLRGDKAVNPGSVIAPALITPQQALAAGLLSPSDRFAQVRSSTFSDSGTKAAMDFVHRIRTKYISEARFGKTRVLLTGGAAFGVDFLASAYGAFPWLLLAVLVISYVLLLRAFRSLFLPFKAVFMNLLSITATYGVLVVFFQHGVGTDLLGLTSSPQIEGWIPIFLFAVLFGLSMDYEVFLLTRMREEWDKCGNNEQAVAAGLQHTGRIITAAAIIMIAAFSGFATGRFVGLQEFGVGLAAAIFLDATLVRALIVPATMKLVGHWNWYLPDGVRRLMRLPEERARRSLDEHGHWPDEDPGTSSSTEVHQRQR